jgi:hypothetical protein
MSNKDNIDLNDSLIIYKLCENSYDINEFIELKKNIDLINNYFLTIENITNIFKLCKFTIAYDNLFLKSMCILFSMLNLEYKNNQDFILILLEIYNILKIINSYTFEIPDTIDLHLIKQNIITLIDKFIINNRFIYLLNKLSTNTMNNEEINYFFILSSINFCQYYKFEEYLDIIKKKLNIAINIENIDLNIEHLKNTYNTYNIMLYEIHDYSTIYKLQMTSDFKNKMTEILKHFMNIMM